MKRMMVTCAIVLALAATTAGTAAAARPAGVSLTACIYVRGGSITAPAGTPVSVVTGWGTRARGQATAFRNAQTTTLSVDGADVPGASSFWAAPEGAPGEGWVTWWSYSTGRTLAAGESLTVAISVSVPHRLADGYRNEEGGVYGPGEVIGGTCTITGV